MNGLEIIARTLSEVRPFGPSEQMLQYHSRSDHHSKLCCWAIAFDLLKTSSLLRRHVTDAKVCIGVNHTMVDFKTSRKKDLDLVIAKPAASLLVLRESALGPAVLMGLRGAGHRFLPNRLVFPGGRVDAADHRAPAATPLAPAVRARLERRARPALAHALAINTIHAAAATTRAVAAATGLGIGNELGDRCERPFGARCYAFS